MPIYEWVRTSYDGYESEYDVWLRRGNARVRIVNHTSIDGHGPRVIISHSSTDPDGTSDSEDESD